MNFVILLFTVIFILSEVNTIFGAQSQGYAVNPKYPGKCYISPNEIYSPGEHQRPDLCEKIHCSSNGWINVYSCGVKQLSNKYGPCEQGDIVDATVPYPNCCQYYFRCKDENGEEYLEIS